MQLISFLVLVQIAFLTATRLQDSFLRLSNGNRDKKHYKLLNLRGGSEQIDWRFFVAGGLCAAFSHGITTPIGLSSDNFSYSRMTPAQTSSRPRCRRIHRSTIKESWTPPLLSLSQRAYGFSSLDLVCVLSVYAFSWLLSGNSASTVVGYGMEGALKFGFYETFKKVFALLTPYQFLNFLLASVVAGAVASIVLVTRLRLSFSFLIGWCVLVFSVLWKRRVSRWSVNQAGQKKTSVLLFLQFVLPSYRIVCASTLQWADWWQACRNYRRHGGPYICCLDPSPPRRVALRHGYSSIYVSRQSISYTDI